MIHPLPLPFHPPFLPGGLSDLSFYPRPSWSDVPQRDGRSLHGVLSVLLRENHSRLPHWSLWRTASRWCVHWLTPEGARMAGRTYVVSFFNRRYDLAVSPVVRVRTPRALDPARYHATIQSLEPICQSRTGHTEAVTRPTTQSIAAGLQNVSERIGYPWDPVLNPLALRFIDRDTEGVSLRIGGKFLRGVGAPGYVTAWRGQMRVECNAFAAWLLLCAQEIGFGGLTSMGFGRVRVIVEKMR